MKREELQVDDGLLCLSINGKSEVIFNPTDIGFIERIFTALEALDTRQNEMEARIHSAQLREVFEIARQADADMREAIDSVLGAGTCAAQFGEMNVYASAQGFPVWANLLFAILDRCESEAIAQQKQQHPRLAKYMAKYGKKT